MRNYKNQAMCTCCWIATHFSMYNVLQLPRHALSFASLDSKIPIESAPARFVVLPLAFPTWISSIKGKNADIMKV